MNIILICIVIVCAIIVCRYIAHCNQRYQLHNKRYQLDNNGLVIITPSLRYKNIPVLYKSINFNKIRKWIIVYDPKVPLDIKQFNHPKIEEYHNDDSNGQVGNQHRNFALTRINTIDKNDFIMFLDDDNIIHPEFWNNIDNMLKQNKKILTFDMIYKDGHIMDGNHIKVSKIDTAQFIIHKSLVNSKNLFNPHKYEADGLFIVKIYKKNKKEHLYIPKVMAYYNYLRNE